MIDTASNRLPHIRETRDGSVPRKQAAPESSPARKENARKHPPALRKIREIPHDKNCVMRKETSCRGYCKSCLRIYRGLHDKRNEIPVFEYIHTILQNLQNFKVDLPKTEIFVNNDGDLCSLFYVNRVNRRCEKPYHFQLFLNILGHFRPAYTKYCSCRNSCNPWVVGKYCLPTTGFCTT